MKIGNNFKQLVLTVPLALAKDTKQWIETEYSSLGENIHFINLLATEPELSYSIYDAELFVGF